MACCLRAPRTYTISAWPGLLDIQMPIYLQVPKVFPRTSWIGSSDCSSSSSPHKQQPSSSSGAGPAPVLSMSVLSMKFMIRKDELLKCLWEMLAVRGGEWSGVCLSNYVLGPCAPASSISSFFTAFHRKGKYCCETAQTDRRLILCVSSPS